MVEENGLSQRMAGAVGIGEEPVDPVGLIESVAHPTCGALTTFFGTVRETSGTKGRSGEVIRLEYEAYHSMAMQELESIVEEVLRTWEGVRVSLYHRIGRLTIGDIAVGIAVASPHRSNAFDACRYVIEEIKKRVPIWKKEVFADGSEWVDPRP